MESFFFFFCFEKPYERKREEEKYIGLAEEVSLHNRYGASVAHNRGKLVITA